MGQAVGLPRQIQRSLSRRRARDFLCLRSYGTKFYTFNLIAEGFLTGGESHKRIKNGSYGNGEYFAVMELLGPVIEKYGLALGVCALGRLARRSLLAGRKATQS